MLGEAVAPCQPTSGPRDDMAIRRCATTLAVRLLLVSRPGADMATVYGELEAAYREAARRAAGYHQWLLRNRSPLARMP